MLRRFTSSSSRFLPIASSSFHQSRQCSSTSTTDDKGNTNNTNSNTTPDSNIQQQQQQQQQQIPQVLQQFDQHMRTNPEFRKLYPKLLKAIVTNSKDDIVKVAEKMSQLTISQSEEEPKSVEKKKKEEGNDVQQSQTLSSAEIAALALNLIVVDVAFADMFYHGEEEGEQQESSSSSPNPLEEEESDEELLQLLLSHFGEDFKKQKARIGKFVLETIQRERDQLMIKEKSLQVLAANKNKKNATSAANRRSSAATLPNFAVTITPPIEAENRVTANLLLKQIKTEVSTLSDFFDGDKQKIVSSVLKRRVFSGAVGPWIHHEGETKDIDEEKQIEQMTKALFQKQKKKAIGDVEFDPDVNMMACRVAVENDFVENKNRRSEDENTASTRINKSSSSNLLRFDIGIEESTFATSIGLDLFFDLEKDGDKAVNEMNDAVSEICKRVSERLNSGFRVGRKTNDNDTGVFGEEAILPFAFTMRCKILMKQ